MGRAGAGRGHGAARVGPGLSGSGRSAPPPVPAEQRAMAAQESTGLANRAGVQDAVSLDRCVLAAPLGREDTYRRRSRPRPREDVPASWTFAPFDRAAVDGIAVRADETVGAGAYNPLLFRLAPDAGDAGPPGQRRAPRRRRPAPARRRRDRSASIMSGSDETGACTVIEPVIAGNEVSGPAARARAADPRSGRGGGSARRHRPAGCRRARRVASFADRACAA